MYVVDIITSIWKIYVLLIWLENVGVVNMTVHSIWKCIAINLGGKCICVVNYYDWECMFVVIVNMLLKYACGRLDVKIYVLLI